MATPLLLSAKESFCWLFHFFLCSVLMQWTDKDRYLLETNLKYLVSKRHLPSDRLCLLLQYRLGICFSYLNPQIKGFVFSIQEVRGAFFV